MESLPSYDNWRTAYPPHYDEPETEECNICDKWVEIDTCYQLHDKLICPACADSIYDLLRTP